MARWNVNHGRRGLPPLWLLVSALWWSAASLSAQALPLKRDVPGSGPYMCPPAHAVGATGAQERTMARQLASSAAQSVILGDLDRARTLLDRATQLDPSSADLAYRHARVLEELKEPEQAISEYCRALTSDSLAEGVNDARKRLDALAAAERAAIPQPAITAFQAGLTHADAAQLERALASFDSAASAAPRWPEAVYDRGVILDRLGRTPGATRDLQAYLHLRPGAPDAIAVSQRIGELRSMALVSRRSPGGALALGILIPGMGQFYSGRALGGFTVLSLAGGAVAAGLLIKKVDVQCLSEPGPGGTCPSGQVLKEVVHRPYRLAGFGTAAAIGVIGAIEAFVKLRGARNPGQASASIDVGRFRVGAPALVASGGRIDLSLVRLEF